MEDKKDNINLFFSDLDRKMQEQISLEVFPILKRNPKELNNLINICVNNKLDPRNGNEVYVLPFKEAITIVVGYHVFINKILKSGKCSGINFKLNYTEDNKNVRSATVILHRIDWITPFEWTVSLGEVTKKGFIWEKMPIFMLRKVAFVQAARFVFGDILGSLPYIKEELEEDNIDKQIEEIKNIYSNKR